MRYVAGMSTLILTQPQVRALLPMDVCIELVAKALEDYSAGKGQNPLRRGLLLEDRQRVFGLMPGRTLDPDTLGLKVVGVFPGNQGTRWDGHQGLVCLFDSQTGVPAAILDGSEVTALRTAAASGLATRLLAREEASHLAILGSGVQARTHLEAMLSVRAVEQVSVFSPNRQNLERFVQRESRRFDVAIEAASSVEAAVSEADLVCTTTSAREPVLRGAWLKPGCHVNAVGACSPKVRELDTQLVALASVFVDSREAALAEAGDLLIAQAEGAFAEPPILAEIGDVSAGRSPARTSPDEVTLFKSLGIAVEDLVSAHYVLEEARRRKVGVEVPLGGLRHPEDRA